MMNRKPSALWVIGKYTLLLVVIYVASAFVAPYKDKLIELAPTAMKPAVEALVPESLPEIKTTSIEPEKKLEVSKIDSGAVTKHPILTQLEKLPETPSLIKRNDTLFWAISPMSTWDDINKVQEEVKKMGSELAVNSIQFDSKQQFISSLVLNHKSERGPGQTRLVDRLDSDAPIHGFSGYATKDDLYSGTTAPELISILKKDHERAMSLYIKSIERVYVGRIFNEFEEMKVQYEKSVYPVAALSTLSTDSLMSKKGIGKTYNNTLFFSPVNAKADFYVNGRKTTFEEVNSLSLKEVKLIHEVKLATQNTKNFFVTLN